MKLKLGAVILVSIFAMAFAPSIATAGSDNWQPTAMWEMNERATATILHDATGVYDGTIGKHVSPTDRRFHQFRREPRDEVHAQHIDRVPHAEALNPGSGDFMVQLRFKWPRARHDMNFVQKGQGSPAGGMFKVKTSVPSQGEPEGGVKCLFRGQTRDSQVMSWMGTAKRFDDASWHVLECRLDSNGSTMFIDGQFVDNNSNQPGMISNTWPVAIGGNTFCDDTATENNLCNYFNGRIDYIRFYH